MSDILGGGGPSTSASNGRSGRPQIPPVTTGSPSGVRGPRDIMRERAAREQRRKEQQEKENMERARAQEEARLLEEQRRVSVERRAAAAGAVGGQRGSGESGQRISGGTAGQRISDNSQRSDRRSGDRVGSGDPSQPLQGVGRGGPAIGGGNAASSSRPRPTQSNQQPRPVQGESSRRPSQTQVPTQSQPQAQSSSRPMTQEEPSAENSAVRSSFPHAFERWESLSAHWEGLTSFWIRRLEENSNEINRDPLSQQLSRQVTDLSAAGANLFHAVVELQRLRASSERKFQRWFFDTRAEQERAQETQALLLKDLERERANRNAMIEEAVEKALLEERSKAPVNPNLDKQLAELKRELQISKEEARRAWEELGRREQEERERTASLRDGHPTHIGGVQVVPMMQGVPSRHGSARDRPPTRDGQGAQSSSQQPYDTADSDVAYQQYSQAQRAEPADPFVETRPIASGPSRSNAATSNPSTSGYEYSQAPAVQPASNSFYQQHQDTSLHPVERDPRYGQSVPSESALSGDDDEYEIDATGDFIRDAKGNRVRYPAPLSDAETDEYDVAADRESELANMQRYGVSSGTGYNQGASATSSRPPGQQTQPASNAPDYSGQGYGAVGSVAPGWEGLARHHHPTRLSDVLEEDERSRTSASQVSRRD